MLILLTQDRRQIPVDSLRPAIVGCGMQSMLERYLAERVTPEQRSRFEAHLMDCAHCRDLVARDRADNRQVCFKNKHRDGTCDTGIRRRR